MLSLTKMFTNDLITEEQYQRKLVGVIEPNRQRLLGRENIIHTIYDPDLGATDNSYWKLTDMDDATVSMGFDGAYSWTTVSESTGKLPIIRSGFKIDRRVMANLLKDGGQKLSDMFGSAAYKMFMKEQEIILLGWDSDVDTTYELPGLYNWTTTNSFSGSTWATAANCVTDILGCVGTLMEDNHGGPYHAYVNATQWLEAFKGVNSTTWDTAYKHIGLALGGPDRLHILPTAHMAASTGMVIQDPGPEWGALTVTQDATPEIVFNQSENMYYCQVFEAIGMEQRDPLAICTITGN